MKKHIVFLFIFIGFYGFSQQKTKGKVYENTEDNKNLPLIGATVMWEGTTEGTQTDINGKFELSYKEGINLIISFIGMRTETITVKPNEEISVTLYPDSMLETIVVERRRQSLSRLRTSSANVQFISSGELLKAACCNLSEAFETNPSIDVNFSDAITGNKQIRM